MNSKFRLEGDLTFMGPGFYDRTNDKINVALTFTRHDGEIGMYQHMMLDTEWAALTPADRRNVFVGAINYAFARDGRMYEPDKHFLRLAINRWADQAQWEVDPTQQFFQLDPYVETRL